MKVREGYWTRDHPFHGNSKEVNIRTYMSYIQQSVMSTGLLQLHILPMFFKKYLYCTCAARTFLFSFSVKSITLGYDQYIKCHKVKSSNWNLTVLVNFKLNVFKTWFLKYSIRVHEYLKLHPMFLHHWGNSCHSINTSCLSHL